MKAICASFFCLHVVLTFIVQIRVALVGIGYAWGGGSGGAPPETFILLILNPFLGWAGYSKLHQSLSYEIGITIFGFAIIVWPLVVWTVIYLLVRLAASNTKIQPPSDGNSEKPPGVKREP